MSILSFVWHNKKIVKNEFHSNKYRFIVTNNEKAWLYQSNQTDAECVAHFLIAKAARNVKVSSSCIDLFHSYTLCFTNM